MGKGWSNPMPGLWVSQADLALAILPVLQPKPGVPGSAPVRQQLGASLLCKTEACLILERYRRQTAKSRRRAFAVAAPTYFVAYKFTTNQKPRLELTYGLRPE